MKNVYRVLISERLAFHHDIEANTAYDAKQKVRASFQRRDGVAAIEPIEDPDGYTG